ncbi:Gfo/Idh/MocA family protein [Afifella sp. IM 167]|uniref:Gfo/Idh/MocA family protein n=1 Tax=Afifella sp. IM 167 TaxID=2033586 RepID=UPI00351CD932
MAVIGTGYGAAVHVPAIMARPDLALASVTDNGSGRAAQIASCGAAAFNDWRAALDHLEGGAAVIAVPPAAQKEIAVAAAKRGIALLCEKPVGRDLAECTAVRAAAEASRSVAATGFQFRFEPGILRLRKSIETGGLGKLREIEVQWHTAGRADPARPMSWNYRSESGGGILLSHMTHILDLLSWLGAGRVERIDGRLATRVAERPGTGGAMESASAEDFAAAWMRTDRGVGVYASIGNSQRGGRGLRITVLGELGTAVFEHTAPFAPSDQTLEIHADGKKDLWRGEGEADDTRLAAGALLLDRFVAAVRGEVVTDLPTVEDACHVHAALERLRRAISEPGLPD